MSAEIKFTTDDHISSLTEEEREALLAKIRGHTLAHSIELAFDDMDAYDPDIQQAEDLLLQLANYTSPNKIAYLEYVEADESSFYSVRLGIKTIDYDDAIRLVIENYVNFKYKKSREALIFGDVKINLSALGGGKYDELVC